MNDKRRIMQDLIIRFDESDSNGPNKVERTRNEHRKKTGCINDKREKKTKEANACVLFHFVQHNAIYTNNICFQHVEYVEALENCCCIVAWECIDIQTIWAFANFGDEKLFAAARCVVGKCIDFEERPSYNDVVCQMSHLFRCISVPSRHSSMNIPHVWAVSVHNVALAWLFIRIMGTMAHSDASTMMVTCYKTLYWQSWSDIATSLPPIETSIRCSCAVLLLLPCVAFYAPGQLNCARKR